MRMSCLPALLFVFSCGAFAAENVDLLKKVKDLDDENPKVRAAAITELAPVFADMLMGLQKASADRDPEVKSAFQACDALMRARMAGKPVGSTREAANETAAVAACKAYATAQDIYRRTDWNKDGVLEYAQSLHGNYSLYENKAGDGDVAMIDRSFAQAEGVPGKCTPKAGYCFRVLTKQGADAPGGARNYVANGHMSLGYALLAVPAEYGKTGRNTFIISNMGVIYQKDLGPDTTKITTDITEYNPDRSWVISE